MYELLLKSFILLRYLYNHNQLPIKFNQTLRIIRI